VWGTVMRTRRAVIARGYRTAAVFRQVHEFRAAMGDTDQGRRV